MVHAGDGSWAAARGRALVLAGFFVGIEGRGEGRGSVARTVSKVLLFCCVGAVFSLPFHRTLHSLYSSTTLSGQVVRTFSLVETRSSHIIFRIAEARVSRHRPISVTIISDWLPYRRSDWPLLLLLPLLPATALLLSALFTP